MSARSRNNLTLIGYGLVLALLAVGVLLVVNRRPAAQGIVLPEPPTPSPLRVHVTGAVAAPGVYALPAGSIVQEAIDAAGGTLPAADHNALNLARLLRDGDQVIVPLIPPTPNGTAVEGPALSANATTAAPANTSPVNLNTATIADLENLPGIGPSLAQRILDYRTEHGPFASIEAIMDVPGIGEGKFEAIKDFISV